MRVRVGLGDVRRLNELKLVIHDVFELQRILEVENLFLHGFLL